MLQAHRARLCTWRKLPACDQALLVLAPLCNGDTYARLAAGFGLGVALRLGGGRAAGRAGPRPDRGAVGADLDVHTNRIRARRLIDPHGQLV